MDYQHPLIIDGLRASINRTKGRALAEVYRQGGSVGRALSISRGESLRKRVATMKTITPAPGRPLCVRAAHSWSTANALRAQSGAIKGTRQHCRKCGATYDAMKTSTSRPNAFIPIEHAAPGQHQGFLLARDIKAAKTKAAEFVAGLR